MVTPTTGLLAASAMPRAAERPTRSPVKLPGPVVDRDAVESCEGDTGLLDDARDQRHQRFGMAALHGQRFLRDQLAGVGVENARGAGIQRGVDGEDQHAGAGRMARWRIANGKSVEAAIRHSLFTIRCSHDHIGRTSTTSGTKCLSRFWMPCCSVAVDDGQPEQAPFMLR